MIESNGNKTYVGMQNAIGTFNGPKPWAELTADEKIELLRDEARKWQTICGMLTQRLSALESHQHGGNGEILVALHNANRAQVQAGAAYDYLR